MGLGISGSVTFTVESEVNCLTSPGPKQRNVSFRVSLQNCLTLRTKIDNIYKNASKRMKYWQNIMVNFWFCDIEQSIHLPLY